MAEQEEDSQQSKVYIVAAAADGSLWARVESFRPPVGRQQEPGKHASSCFNVSSCCYSKTRQMHDVVGWAWASACVEQGLSSCMHMTYRNVTEHSITSSHRILHKMYMQKHSTGTVGLAGWCSTTEMSKMVYIYMLLHTGVAPALRHIQLSWWEQMKHTLPSLLTCVGPHHCM